MGSTCYSAAIETVSSVVMLSHIL